MTSDASVSREVLVAQFCERYDLKGLAPERMDLALTHRSYANEIGAPADNERLEFLGDAIVGSACSRFLYDNYANSDEGEMSKLRSLLVSRATLGKRARDMDIGPLLLLGKGEGLSGGRLRRTLLGSALEAVVGVIFLDLGYDPASAFVIRHIVEPSLQEIDRDNLVGDYKSALQEWTQARNGTTPHYRLVEEQGPDHGKTFTVEVEIDGRTLARGEGPRIKRAENDAARRALDILKGEEEAVAADGEDG